MGGVNSAGKGSFRADMPYFGYKKSVAPEKRERWWRGASEKFFHDLAKNFYRSFTLLMVVKTQERCLRMWSLKGVRENLAVP